MIYGVYQYRIGQVRFRFEAVLAERSRLAREMHDTVIQGCTGVSALIEALSMDGSGKGAGLLDLARLQLRTTINEAREAVWNLHQSDSATTNVGEKIESMTLQISREFNIPVTYAMTGIPFGLSHPMAHDLLMVAREAVFNAVRHGSPKHVEVTLTYSQNELVLGVIDDGCGFNPEVVELENGHHFGLRGMKERVERSGGRFSLTSVVGEGIAIEAHLPRNSKAR